MNPFVRLAEFLEDWKFLIQRNGIWSASREIFIEITRFPFRHLHFYILEYSLNNPLPEIFPKLELEIRPFEVNDLTQVKKIDRPSEARQCERRIENGDQGLAATFQGELVGYAWGCTKINPQLERVPIQLGPGYVLCTDVYTNPSFRGKGVQTALSLARFSLFKDIGYEKAICYIEMRNTPSFAVWQKKLGAQITGKIDFLRILLWHHVRIEDNIGRPNYRDKVNS